jgi:heterotetrameric sarcosine oxidase gamma subunit
LAPLPPAVRLLIRGDAIGFAPPAPCRAIRHGDNWVLWLGPDELLLIARDEEMPVLDTAATSVDVSHRDTALRVSGPRAAWALNAFCALDLDDAAFPVGMCTRTVFGKAAIVLWRTGVDEFRIEVARSLAPYVWGCLEDARREFLD